MLYVHASHSDLVPCEVDNSVFSVQACIECGGYPVIQLGVFLGCSSW